MDLSDATNYDLFSASIDGEYSSEEIKAAANHLNISEDNVLSQRAGERIVAYLMDGVE